MVAELMEEVVDVMVMTVWMRLAIGSREILSVATYGL